MSSLSTSKTQPGPLKDKGLTAHTDLSLSPLRSCRVNLSPCSSVRPCSSRRPWRADLRSSTLSASSRLSRSRTRRCSSVTKAPPPSSTRSRLVKAWEPHRGSTNTHQTPGSLNVRPLNVGFDGPLSVWPLTSGAWSSTGVTVMLKSRPETVPPWWSLTEKTNWTDSVSGPMSSTGGMKATFMWLTACCENKGGSNKYFSST